MQRWIERHSHATYSHCETKVQSHRPSILSWMIGAYFNFSLVFLVYRPEDGHKKGRNMSNLSWNTITKKCWLQRSALFFFWIYKTQGDIIFSGCTQNVYYESKGKRTLWRTGEDHLLTYLLTYSMEQSPSWEANLVCS